MLQCCYYYFYRGNAECALTTLNYQEKAIQLYHLMFVAIKHLIDGILKYGFVFKKKLSFKSNIQSAYNIKSLTLLNVDLQNT